MCLCFTEFNVFSGVEVSYQPFHRHPSWTNHRLPCSRGAGKHTNDVLTLVSIVEVWTHSPLFYECPWVKSSYFNRNSYNLEFRGGGLRFPNADLTTGSSWMNLLR